MVEGIIVHNCKHHSKAKGGKPVKRAIRDLAWVVVRWAKQVRPRIIILENVEEFRDWGPLDIDGRPCKERKGKTFDAWSGELRRLGYKVEWRELRACDFGAPTIRKRLFLIARRDGRRIVWPAPTHGKPGAPDVVSGKLLPWRSAAEIIDWSIPCPSIFLTREEGRAIGVNRPLAPNTMTRIAKGVKRYVIDAAEPFIVPVTHAGDARVHGMDEPLRTVTTAQRGEHAVITPVLVGCGGRAGQSRPRGADEPTATITTKADTCVVAPYLVPRYGERPGQEPRTRSIEEPMPTVVPTGNGGSLAAVSLIRHFGASVGSAADDPVGTVTAGGGGKTGVVAAFLAQHNTGNVGREAEEPLSTITHRGTQQSIVAAHITKFSENSIGHQPDEPLHTAMAGAPRHGVVTSFLTHHYTSNTAGGSGDMRDPKKTVLAGGTHAAEVRAFLIKYYGTGGQEQSVDDPLHTATAKARFGLVTVRGETYQIADIGMRMLTPRELFRAQGFPDSYQIETGSTPAGAISLNKTAQVRMCGNSVCPPMARALVAANYVPDERDDRQTPALADLPLLTAAE